MASKERKVKNKTDPDELNPIRPNLGVGADYRKRLRTLITSMQNSVEHWISSVYRHEEATLTTKVKSVKNIQKAIEDLKLRWFTKFDEAAPKMAAEFVARAAHNLDANMTRQLAARNFAIKFELTPEMRAVVHAEIVQNVSLIQSIPSQYFTEVEGLVMRSVAAGGDLKTLSRELHERYGVTQKRAALIARDQNSKVNAVMNRVRCAELGFTHAEWIHTDAGHEPRASHKAFSGKIFEIAKGAFIDGEFIQPGEKINCHCISRVIRPAYMTNRGTKP